MRRLRRTGLALADIRTLVLPATGPKWLATAGIDRALAQQPAWGVTGERVLVAGSSAGAWRALALTARDPARAQRRLCDVYCAQHFTRADSPEVISAAYRKLLRDVFEPDDLRHALGHPRFELAITTARVRGSARRQPSRRALGLQLLAAGAINLVHPAAVRALFERVEFRASAHARNAALLDLGNIAEVALASGSVPLYMAPVRGLRHADQGTFVDGGLVEYHVNQRWPVGDGVSLLVSHEARVIPGWFDKWLPWRNGRSHADNLVVVYPDPEFIRSLPGARVPSREDFVELLHAPEERQQRWLAVAQASDQLGAALLEDLRSGAVASVAQAF
jgi:Patatin-like phospholipase